MTITSFFARSAVVAAGSTLMLSAVAPAVAATRHNTTDANQQQYRVVKSRNGTVRYCTQLPAVTGSIMRPTVCKTAEEWAQEGVKLNLGDNG